MRGLSKRVKAELELQSGQLQVEIDRITASDEDRLARIIKVERFMDRIRASNIYGEPIVNFNEDSATKEEMKELIAAEVVNFQKRIK